jgi:hypothetical protein
MSIEADDDDLYWIHIFKCCCRHGAYMRTRAIDAQRTSDQTGMSEYLDPLTIVVLAMLTVLALLRRQPDD